MKNLLLLVLACLGNAGLAGAAETVLKEGERFVAKNMNGEFGSEWASPTARKYVWPGGEKKVVLIQRAEPWNGSLGMYNPGSASIFSFSKRVVCEEGILRFSKLSEAREWLKKQRPFDWVYTDDGLVAGFFESPDRNQINIELWQFYVNGKRPVGLGSKGQLEILIKK